MIRKGEMFKMQTYQKECLETTIFVTTQEEYQQEAEMVMEYIADLVDEITEKTIVEFHYAYVGFEPVENGFRVVVPDLAHHETEKTTENLTYFLQIIHDTFEMAKLTKTQGKLMNFTFKQHIVVANNAFSGPEFYAHRFEGDTWYIAPIDPKIETQPLTGKLAYELLPEHPELYAILHLPVDYIALYANGELVSVLNEESEEVLNKQ